MNIIISNKFYYPIFISKNDIFVNTDSRHIFDQLIELLDISDIKYTIKSDFSWFKHTEKHTRMDYFIISTDFQSISTMSEQEYKKMVKKLPSNFLFYKKNLNPETSYLIEVDENLINETYDIQQKKYSAEHYKINFIHTDHIHKNKKNLSEKYENDKDVLNKKYNAHEISEEEYYKQFDILELDYEKTSNIYPPKYAYKDDYLYFLLESDGTSFVIEHMYIFDHSKNNEIKNHYTYEWTGPRKNPDKDSDSDY